MRLPLTLPPSSSPPSLLLRRSGARSLHTHTHTHTGRCSSAESPQLRSAPYLTPAQRRAMPRQPGQRYPCRLRGAAVSLGPGQAAGLPGARTTAHTHRSGACGAGQPARRRLGSPLQAATKAHAATGRDGASRRLPLDQAAPALSGPLRRCRRSCSCAHPTPSIPAAGRPFARQVSQGHTPLQAGLGFIMPGRPRAPQTAPAPALSLCYFSSASVLRRELRGAAAPSPPPRHGGPPPHPSRPSPPLAAGQPGRRHCQAVPLLPWEQHPAARGF